MNCRRIEQTKKPIVILFLVDQNVLLLSECFFVTLFFISFSFGGNFQHNGDVNLKLINETHYHNFSKIKDVSLSYLLNLTDIHTCFHKRLPISEQLLTKNIVSIVLANKEMQGYYYCPLTFLGSFPSLRIKRLIFLLGE